MRLQIEIQRESFVAVIIWAHESLLSSVHEHVPLELGIINETFIAAFPRAFEGFLSVDAHMFSEA